MNNRYDQVEELFHKVIDLSPEERESYLEEQVGGDLELRGRVERLVAHFESTGGTFLKSPAQKTPAMAADAGIHDEQMPERVGIYPVLGELGRGGMGVVYRALDPRLKREVALKVLPSALAADHSWTERLQQEARLLASVNHPAIATIFALDEDDGRTFITLELVEGESLAAKVRAAPLSLTEALHVAQQVGVALEAAHLKGVIHRDLKPANVMVRGDGTVKVLDFGIATTIAQESSASAQDVFAGTPGFMSPEQLRGEPTNARADIFAFGCLVYECLTGSPAFAGETVADIIHATLHREPDWARLSGDVPEALAALLRSCVAKVESERPGSIVPVRRAVDEELALLARPERPTAGTRVSGVPNNLLTQLSSFVGREDETQTLAQWLTQHRVVTLTGAGGSGKSRLALEVARQNFEQFPDGVWLVELAPLHDGSGIDAAVASAIGLRDTPGAERIDAIVGALAGKRVLLILDNCEHLVEHAARFVHMLVERLERLVVLATSREVLGLPGEHQFQVRGMGAEATQLFEQRARAVRPDFAIDDGNRDAVESICAGLDRIPLAIELAAARTRVLSPRDIADRLSDRFRLLAAGKRQGLPHHRTLRSLIDWSYEQLESSEQRFLARLSIFAGGWTLAAAEEVCTGDGTEAWEALDLLTRLLDKSLIELEPWEKDATRVRYRMLETVRAYADEHLDGRAAIEARHRAYFSQVALAARDGLSGSDQVDWIRDLTADRGNLLLAFDTGAALTPVDADIVPITVAMMGLEQMQGRPSEADVLGRRALALPGLREGRGEQVGHVLHRLGNAANSLGHMDAAQAWFEEAFGIWDELGHERNKAGVLNNRGLVAHARGQSQEAIDLFSHALAINRSIGNRDWESTNLNNLGMVANQAGRTEEARRYYKDAVEIGREIGNKFFLAMFLDNYAVTEAFVGEPEKALETHQESLELYRELGNLNGEATVLLNMASALKDLGDIERARQLIQSSLRIRRQIEGSAHRSLIGVEALADLLIASGDVERAVTMCGAAAAFRDERELASPMIQQQTVDRMLVRAREAIGDAAYQRAWARGTAMSVGEAIDLGLAARDESR